MTYSVLGRPSRRPELRRKGLASDLPPLVYWCASVNLLRDGGESCDEL